MSRTKPSTNHTLRTNRWLQAAFLLGLNLATSWVLSLLAFLLVRWSSSTNPDGTITSVALAEIWLGIGLYTVIANLLAGVVGLYVLRQAGVALTMKAVALFLVLVGLISIGIDSVAIAGALPVIVLNWVIVAPVWLLAAQFTSQKSKRA